MDDAGTTGPTENNFLELLAGYGRPTGTTGTTGPTGTAENDLLALLAGYGRPTDTTGSTEPTGPTGPVYIMTIDELILKHDTTTKSESTDKNTLNSLVIPSSSGIQTNLIQWAAAGFPPDYTILSMNLIHPSPCSDGGSRNILEYISFLTDSDIMTLTTKFQSNFLGISFSYSVSGNTVNLHVSKSSA